MAKEFIVYSPTKALFEAQVASGEVDNTQIGIIAESGEFWENGNYHPLILLTDYLKKTDAVTLAKDLTGRIEATSEEFTFRTSAGTKSIRDESAVIRRIKGNTSVWGQLLGEMTADNWNQYSNTYTNIEYLENGCKSTILSAYAGGNVYQLGLRYKPTVTHYVSGHKYMVIFDAYVEVSGQMSVETNDTTYYSPVITAGQWVTTFVTFTRNGTVNNFYVKPPKGYQTTASVGKTYSVRNAMLFDLTALYESGNEPTTLEEFKKLYPESYYPYCEPEVRSMRATGIETIGANAFNKDSVVGGLINADGTVTSNDIYSVAKIEVVPNEKYTLTNVANAANTTYTYALYDSNDRFISVGEIKNSVTKPLSVSGDVTMPLNARYIRVVVHNDYIESCCVNLKHSGTLTAEEATYFKEVRTLPDIAKYFPEGMHGIGDVFDEINEENVVKRFGVVDLGTLTWASNATSSSTGGLRRWTTSSIKSVFPTGTNNYEKSPNMVCLKYPTGSINSTFRGELSIACGSGGDIFLFDPEYTSNDDKDAFVASLQGVMLVYELAEPIVTPITEPLQLDYKVADFGTEKMVNFYPSSPFRADIVYAFNAADRINDNERNIERIEEAQRDFATRNYVQEYVATNAPAVAAPAMPRTEVTNSSLTMAANTIYYYTGGIGVGIEEFVHSVSEGSVDDVWILRFAPSASMMQTLSLPSYLQNVYWEEGSSASMPAIGYIYEFQFRKIDYYNILAKRIVYKK